MPLRYTAGGGLRTQALEKLLRGVNPQSSYDRAIARIAEITQGGPVASANLAMDTLGPQGNEEWGAQSEEFIEPGKSYKFQAWPGCCPKCQALDGMTIAGFMDSSSVSHPNCKCKIVPASEYKPFGS